MSTSCRCELDGRADRAAWRKHGLNRLYVNDPEQGRIGWVDVVTGHSTLDDPSRADEFHAAVTRFLAGPGQSVPRPRRDAQERAAPVAAVTEPEPELASANEMDLLGNRPGQSLRELAAHESQQRGRFGLLTDRMLGRHTRERAWRVGARGEEVIGQRLDKLSAHGWHVLHSVPVGERGGDIDHVLIGPGGVFTINTKNHPGKSLRVDGDRIRVDGYATAYVGKSRHEAQRAQRLLSAATGTPVTVRSALVLLTGTVFPDITIIKRPDGVLILDRRDIPDAFRRAKTRLTATEIEVIVRAAGTSSTWTSNPR